METLIRTMNISDVEEVVAVHLSSFPGYFLSFLGPRFLSPFYSGICSAPESIAIVALNDVGMPIGFVAGSLNPQGFYSRLLKQDWYRFVCASISPILRKPSSFWRVARAISHPSDNPFGNDVAGLFSIGILPEFQGKGVGKKLVRAFLDQAKLKGCKNVFLTTDRDHNDAVNAFYRNNGFSVRRQFVTPEGRRMNEYWITII